MAELVIKLVNGELAGKSAQSIAKEITAAGNAARKAEAGTKAWVDAHQRLDHAKKLQEDLKKQVLATTSASDQLKAAWNNLPGAGFFNQISQSVGMVQGGVGGLVTKFGVLKAAIAATGIGLLVIALVTLVNWFSKTDEGATFLGGVMRGLQAITEKLFSGIRALGSALVAAFENPKQAAKDFVDFLKDQVMNRINSFGVGLQALNKLMHGDFKEGFKQLADAQIQFTFGITNGTDKLAAFANGIAETVKEGIALEAELDRIADRARELGVLQAQTEKDVSRLLLQSKNVSLSYEERIALLDKASELESANHAKQLANARDLEAAMQREVDAKMLTGNVTDELDQKLKDSQIARINLEKESINLQEKIDNRRSALLEKQQAEREKDLAKYKKLEEDRFKILRNIEDTLLQAKHESREKDLEAVRVQLQREIEDIDENAPYYAERVAAAQELAKQKRDEVNTKWNEKDLQKKVAALELEFITEQNVLNEQFLNKQLTADQWGIATAKQLVDQQAERLRLIKAAHGEESLEYQRGYADFLKLQQAGADASVEITKNLNARQMQALQGGLEVFGNVFGSLASMYEQGTAQWKSMAVAQAIISTIQGSINAYTSTAQIPYIGPILAPVAAGVALAAGMANVRKIQNTKTQSPIKKELGGPLYGPRHSQGGIPIEAEGGEFIFSRKAVSAIGVGELNRVNDFYTKRFAMGGPINPFQDRAPVSSSSGRVQTVTVDNNALMSKIDDLIAAQDRRIDRIKVINMVTDTDEGIKTINRIKEEANT